MRVVTLPDESYLPAVRDDDGAPLPGLEPIVWDMSAPLERASEVSLVVPPYLDGDVVLDHLDALGSLEAVQLLTAGYDSIADRLPAGVRLANAAGLHDDSTAELALALTLAAQRELPEAVLAQQRGHWLPTTMTTMTRALADSRVLLVGYGSIGRAIARRLAPFEVRLTAVASRARSGDEHVARVAGIEELPSLLPEADIVILVVPLTDATRGLVDADALSRMPRGSLLVNVARGPVVDTDALVDACREGRVRAAVDVTDPEPLPADHPLWSTPGVLVSPHRGGASAAFLPRAIRLLRAQLTRWGAGQPLEHVVR